MVPLRMILRLAAVSAEGGWVALLAGAGRLVGGGPPGAELEEGGVAAAI